MGEDATEAVELSCPGCGGYLRLKLRGGSLPQGIVPCPMCMVDIPVSASNVARHANADGDKIRPSSLTPSHSKMTPMHGEAVTPQWTFRKESSAAIAEIEEQIRPTRSVPMASVSDAPAEIGVLSTVKKDKLRARLERNRQDALNGDHPGDLSSGDVFSEVSGQSAISEFSDPASLGDQLPERPMTEAGEERPSLASLFQKVRAKHASPSSSDALELPASKENNHRDLPASPDTRENYSAAKARAETTRDDSEELSEDEFDAFLASSEVLLAESSASSHDGLFAGLTPPSAPAPRNTALSAPPIPTVSNRPGRPTSGSMLARLQKRREQDDSGNEAGQADEGRGSGYICLPTTGIQEVLGRGSSRLRIEGVIYEPLDIEGLIQLIKGGVLLGAEEIAEADGDWSPVSEHPVFDELRRRMAAEAHALLSGMGQVRRNEDDSSEPIVEVQGSEAQQSPTSGSANPSATLGTGTSEEDAPLTEDLDDLIDSLDEQPSPASPPVVPEVTAEPSDPFVEPATVAAPAALIESEPELASEWDTALIEDDPSLVPGKKRRGLVLAVLAVAAAIAVAAGVYLSGGFSPSPGPQVAAPSLPTEQPPAQVPAQALPSGAQVSAAIEQVEKALPLVLADKDQHLDWARQQLIAGNAREAVLVLGAHWIEGAEDALFDPYTEALLAAGEYRRLRVVAIEAMRRPVLNEKARAMFARSLAEDQDLRQSEPIGIDKDPGLRILGLESIAGVERLIIESDSKRFIFKPAQPNFEDGWRIEVATYRLCEAIFCTFRIPQTRPARLERAGLDVQAAQWPSEGRERLQDVNWSWKSAEGVQFVDGSLQEVIDHDAVWPIEDLPLWHDWLSVTSNAKVFEQPLADNIDRVRERSGLESYARLLAASEGASTGDLSQQMADILTFDFLANNWERFQTNSERFGTYTPIVAGQVLSIHNGEAFQPRSSRRVLDRFEWTSRYSRTMVDAVRALEPELVNDLLFPSPSAVDRVRLNVFWSQRSQMLERVDDLIDRHGEDKVLFFDSSR